MAVFRMASFNSAVFVLLFATFAYGALPPWIKPCKVGPKFNECSIKNGRMAMPHVIKGDPKYKVPTVDPLTIDLLEVTDKGSKSVAMNITLKNAKIYGLRHANFASSKFDFKKKHIEWVFDNIDLIILCDYKISGRFLVVPIVGSGKGNITLDNVKLTTSIDYKTEKRKGVEYPIVTNVGVKYTTDKLGVQLQNLFNGDKLLAKNMIDFMNENWKDLNNSVGPSIAHGISLYVKQIIENIIKNVPLKDIFIP